jgi:hypothetical protein
MAHTSSLSAFSISSATTQFAKTMRAAPRLKQLPYDIICLRHPFVTAVDLFLRGFDVALILLFALLLLLLFLLLLLVVALPNVLLLLAARFARCTCNDSNTMHTHVCSKERSVRTATALIHHLCYRCVLSNCTD